MHMKNAKSHFIIQRTRGHLSSATAMLLCLAIGEGKPPTK